MIIVIIVIMTMVSKNSSFVFWDGLLCIASSCQNVLPTFSLIFGGQSYRLQLIHSHFTSKIVDVI